MRAAAGGRAGPAPRYKSCSPSEGEPRRPARLDLRLIRSQDATNMSQEHDLPKTARYITLLNDAQWSQQRGSGAQRRGEEPVAIARGSVARGPSPGANTDAAGPASAASAVSAQTGLIRDSSDLRINTSAGSSAARGVRRVACGVWRAARTRCAAAPCGQRAV
ncbi:unnamed protein product [Chrysodeixis includens]|uniref:Uncharacterized protein n=1 Tax=Chrysodeixis includens TaxID=689277 RepID=A0A9N8KUB5_CHRIL|nr:unnamed protein product [Chrysodeixis includens]